MSAFTRRCYGQLERAAAVRQMRTTRSTCRRPISAVQSFFSTLTQISPAFDTFGWKIFVMKNPARGAARRHREVVCKGQALLVHRGHMVSAAQVRADWPAWESRSAPSTSVSKVLDTTATDLRYLDAVCHPTTTCSSGGATGGAPFGGDAGKSCPRTSFILKTPPSNGVPAAVRRAAYQFWQRDDAGADGSGLVG